MATKKDVGHQLNFSYCAELILVQSKILLPAVSKELKDKNKFVHDLYPDTLVV